MCTLDLLEGTKLEDMEVAGGSPQYKRGLWTEEEDKILMEYVDVHGKGQWNRIAKKTGLKRCGKSCRLRWMNYLSPNVKRGNFTEEEDDLIIRLHKLLGNRWSLIAGRVPGRTDNQVKNYWNTHLSKRNGCIKKRRRKEESFTTNPETSKSVVSSKDSETMTAASLTVAENAELETTATATDNDPIVDSLSAFPQNAYTFLADGDIYGSSVSWRDQVDEQMSSLVQFSDEFLQFDFGWSSVFSD